MCDPVEDDSYGYKIGNVTVTDFVTPNWFAHEHAQGDIDLKKHARAPFQILSGGYAQKWDPNAGWQQVTGAQAMSSIRAHAPHGSRRDRRFRQRLGWRHSDVNFKRR